MQMFELKLNKKNATKDEEVMVKFWNDGIDKFIPCTIHLKLETLNVKSFKDIEDWILNHRWNINQKEN